MNAFLETFGLTPLLLASLTIGVSVFATFIAVAMPLVAGDRLKSRMKAVATEREAMRAQERAKLGTERGRGLSLRQQESSFSAKLVERLSLKNALADEKTIASLRIAGYRGQQPLNVFLAARAILPLLFGTLGAFFVFGFGFLADSPFLVRFLVCILAAFAGFYLPIAYVSNVAFKRVKSISRAWPDALDLLLICVEAGNSIEAAFRRVSDEIGIQSIPLAEELVLVTAELSYLPDRRIAYDNFAARTGIEGVKAVCMALIQAERYGTPLGNAIRVLAQENRDMRMMAAEKQAAALPPKLTVPMIVFFLPVLFAVIIGPAAIKIAGMM